MPEIRGTVTSSRILSDRGYDDLLFHSAHELRLLRCGAGGNVAEILNSGVKTASVELSLNGQLLYRT